MKKIIIIFTVILTTVVLFIFLAVKLTPSKSISQNPQESSSIGEAIAEEKNQEVSFLQNECEVKEKKFTVVGNSLLGLIESGTVIKILENYYFCHNPERNDIVAYNYSGNTNPIIKIVKAIPKDNWQIKETDGGYLILVNGLEIKNSLNQSYLIPAQKSSMLKIYSQNYPVIPENTYLILGNLREGSLDSTQFGLVSKEDLLGKVEMQ